MRFLSRACVMLVSDHFFSIDALLQCYSNFSGQTVQDSGFGTNAHNFGLFQIFQDVWSVDILRSFSTALKFKTETLAMTLVNYIDLLLLFKQTC